MQLVGSPVKLLIVDFAILDGTHALIQIIILIVLHILPLSIWTPLQLCICVILQGVNGLGRFLDVGEEFVKHGLRLIRLVDLLLDLLELQLKLAVSCTLVLFGFGFVHFVEGLKLISANVVDNTAEVFLELSKLTLDSFLEDLGVNYGVVQVDRFTIPLKFFRDLLVISTETYANLVICELLQAEAEVALEIIDDLVCPLLRLMHHREKLIKFRLTI